MSKQKKFIKYVNHPRYGSEPLPSSENLAVDAIESAHWRYASLHYFPQTALAADISKQKYALYPRAIYVDIEEKCQRCNRPFLFFAKEQQYWFETLGFWVDAHCTRCIECRKKDHEIRQMQKRYQELIACQKRSSAESRELKKIAMELYQSGYIRDAKKLDIDIVS